MSSFQAKHLKSGKKTSSTGKVKAKSGGGKASAKKVAIQARLKKGKAKAKSKREVEREVTEAEQRFEDWIGDIEARQAIRQRLLAAVANMRGSDRVDPFPMLSRHLAYEIPFTEEELKDLGSEPRILSATYLERVRDQDGQGGATGFHPVAIRVIAAAQVYSQLLRKLPYSAVRSQILEQADIFSRLRDRPVLLEQLLHQDELVSEEELETLRLEYEFPLSILKLVQTYNSLLGSGPHRPLPPSPGAVIGPLPKPTDVAAKTRLHLTQLIKEWQVTGGVIAKAEALARDDEEKAETKSKTEEDIGKATKRQVQLYRAEIRTQLAAERDVDPEVVTEDEIDETITKGANLPAWAFLAQFISTTVSGARTRHLLDASPQLGQFGRLFRRLTSQEQVDFAVQVFTVYPIEDWPYGPKFSLLSQLTEYYNRIIAWKPSDDSSLDNRLATIPATEFSTLFKSLQPAQTLHYRDIVFGRLPDLSEFDRAAILAVYNSYLSDPDSTLAYDAEENEVNLFDSEMDVKTPSKLDFVLPWTPITQAEIKTFLETSLNPRVVGSFQLPAHLRLETITTLKVALPGGVSVPLVGHAMKLLIDYFNALPPAQVDFTNFVRSAILKLLQDFVAAPAGDPLEIKDLPVEIPAPALNALTRRLARKRDEERLGHSAEELQREASRLGLSLKGSMSQAAAETKSRLGDQLRLGEITPAAHEAAIDELNVFLAAYTTLQQKSAYEPADLKRKRREFRRYHEERVKILTTELTARVKAISSQAWDSAVESGFGTASEIKQLQAFLTRRMNDLREAADEEGEEVTEAELTEQAWKDAAEEDVLTSKKLKRVRELYTEQVEKIEASERRTHPDAPFAIDEVIDLAWKESVAAGIMTAEELEQLTATRAKLPRLSKTLKQRADTELKAKVAEMPEALRQSLARMIDGIARDLERVDAAKRLETATYFKFLSAIMVASWKARTGDRNVTDLLVLLEGEYSQKLPLPYIKKVLEMVHDAKRTGRTLSWSDLLKFTQHYTQRSVMIIRNPLVRQTARRKRRYNRLFERIVAAGDVSILRRELPAPMAPHLKECVAAHQLKPWLDIPHIQRWTFLVADAKGRRRDRMSPNERLYFNLPKEREFVLVQPTGKRLYFYRPTTAYWVAHCHLHHAASDPLACDLDGLRKTLSGAAPQFYELMVRLPLPGVKTVEHRRKVGAGIWALGSQESVLIYTGDTDRVKFLSMDPTVYERECAWFNDRYRGVEERMLELRSTRASLARDVRLQGMWELRQALSLLRVKYGEAVEEPGAFVRADIRTSAEKLEQVVFDTAPGKVPLNVYSYFRALYSLVLFLDVTDPVTKEAVFFQGLVAQCADAYYPHLMRDFATPQKRFPEVFLLPRSETVDLLKEKVLDYVEQKTQLMIDRALLRTLALSLPEFMVQPQIAALDERQAYLASLTHPKEQPQNDLDRRLANLLRAGADQAGDYALSIGSLFTRDGLNVVARVPNLALKNICVNADDYKDLSDSWLMYYVHQDRVYCISKLQLAGMAQAKKYTFAGVPFEQPLVDGFASYADFTASELGRRREYVEGVTQALVHLPQNKPLFQRLVEQKAESGALASDDVADVLGQLSVMAGPGGRNKLLERDDAYLIMLVTNRLEELVDAYISAEIMEMVEAFVKTNGARLASELKTSYEAAQAKDPLLPSGGLQVVQDPSMRALILTPAVNLIVKHVESASDFTVGPRDRQAIASLIQRTVTVTGQVPPKAPTPISEGCAACKAKLAAAGGAFQTMVQSREGLATRNKYLAFCSKECFSKFKIREPSDDDASLARLQNAVNEVTKPYLDQTQMALWARFPPAWKLPTDSAARYKLLAKWAKIRSLDPAQLREVIQTLSLSENFLGIFTRDASGRQLSQAELWDRIRTHPLFVPATAQMLETTKFEALRALANQFGVPMYDGEDWEAFYTAEPEELRNAWKQLRAKPAFVKMLFSTVRTFDPNEAPVPLHPAVEAVQGADVLWESARAYCRQMLEGVADLALPVLVDPERIGAIRTEVLKGLAAQFPSLSLSPDLRRVYRMFTLRKTLKLWFDNHMAAMLGRGSAVIDFPADKTKRTLSSVRLIRELQGLCRHRITPHDFSVWTIGVIRSHLNKSGQSAPEQTKFTLDFWPQLKEHFECSGLKQLEESYTEHTFNLEKMNRLIDDLMAEVINERQRPALVFGSPDIAGPPVSSKARHVIGAPGVISKGRKLPAKARAARAEEPELKEILDQVAAGDLAAPAAVAQFEPATKARLEILAKLQEFRRAALKQVKNVRQAEQKVMRVGARKEEPQMLAWVPPAVEAGEIKAVDSEEKRQAAELKKLLASANRMLDVHGGDVQGAMAALEQKGSPTHQCPLGGGCGAGTRGGIRP